MTASTETLPVDCKSWCIRGNGHPDEAFREDQYCLTSELYVNLSRPGYFIESDRGRPERLHVPAGAAARLWVAGR